MARTRTQKGKCDSGILDWLLENGAEFIDSCEGCLLDNALLSFENRTIALYEYCASEWSSGYRYEMEYNPAPHVMKRWDKFREEIDPDLY